MKFEITRASLYRDETPPCEGATQEVHTHTVKVVAKYANREYMDTNPRLLNLREEGKYLVYETMTPRWVIEVPDLPALLALIDREGRVVLGQDGEDYSIEIYDDYRE